MTERRTCAQKDHDGFDLVCGYPLPCPHHTIVAHLNEAKPTRAHLTSDAADFRYIRREARDIERAVGRLEKRDRNLSKGSAVMPLVHGYSPKSIEENIVREMRAGRAQPQAVAIAFETARKAWRHAHPKGPYPAHLRGMRKARRRH